MRILDFWIFHFFSKEAGSRNERQTKRGAGIAKVTYAELDICSWKPSGVMWQVVTACLPESDCPEGSLRHSSLRCPSLKCET